MDDSLGPIGPGSIPDSTAVERLRALVADTELCDRIEDTARDGDVNALVDLVLELADACAEARSELTGLRGGEGSIQEQP